MGPVDSLTDLPGHQFSLVTANLRAPTLHELKPVITAYLRAGGAIVLSGIKQNERADIKTTYEDACMSCRREETEKDWAGLVFFNEDCILTSE